MGGVALNMSADREPVLWLPAMLIATLRRARLALPRAAARARHLGRPSPPFAPVFCRWDLRTARVETPMLDHVRTVKLQGFVDEVDIRPTGGRFIIRVAGAGNMPLLWCRIACA